MSNPPKNLDSQIMSTKLLGTTFPNGEFDTFIDTDVATFFAELFALTKLKKSDVIRDANIARTYGYQLFNGTRKAHRDSYLRIAFAMKLDLRTTQRLLAVTQTGALHPLIKRDAAIIFALNHNYNLMQTYDFLVEMNLPPLEHES